MKKSLHMPVSFSAGCNIFHIQSSVSIQNPARAGGLQTIFIGGTADTLLKEAAKMLRILKSQRICYLGNGLVGLCDEFFRGTDHLFLNILLRTPSGFPLKHISEIIGRKTELVGEILHRRQTVTLGHSSLKITVNQLVELSLHAVAGLDAGKKLTFVKTHAIIQQQFELVDDKFLAELVISMTEFHFEHPHAAHYNLPLLFRKMQGLIDLIREKGITLNGPAQRSILQQVRMKQYPYRIQLHTPILRSNLRRLSGSETDYRSLLIIVIRASVLDVTLLFHFQIKRINAIMPMRIVDKLCRTVQVGHTDLRMQCLQSVQLIILCHAVQINLLIHSPCLLIHLQI